MISTDTSAVFRPLQSGGVILNAEDGSYFEVNSTGRFIWEHLESGIAREKLIGVFAANFGLAAEQAEGDVTLFLEELQKRSLIVEE
jgi:hypothetical protein